MKIFKKAFFPLAILPLKNILHAQKRDSIPQKVIAFVTDKFPQTRDFNVEYTQVAPYKYTSELHGSELLDNKIKNYQQVKANANIYFIKNRKWVFSTAINYRFTAMNIENPISALSEEQSTKGNFHYHAENFTVTRFSKLFNKIAVYTASVAVDGSDQHFERFRGMLTGTLVLKANAKTKMTVGIAAIIDPSAQVPAIPIFTYENKFNNGWVADIILPKKVVVRKDVFSNGRISFGTEMDNTSFYIYNSGKTYEFRQLEINSGIIYEHRLGGDFIGTLKTGLRATPNARIFEKQESFKDYLFKAKFEPSYYINVGISYNPFGKPRKQ